MLAKYRIRAIVLFPVLPFKLKIVINGKLPAFLWL